MLTTTVLACRCPKIAAPAMNTGMYENPVTQDNLDKLRHYGWEIVEPGCGHLACGTSGKGRMPEPEELLQVCLHALRHEKDMVGKRVLVTAGPTREALDPVRYLTNHSSGKMGYAIAKAAAARGAEVTLVSGPVELPKPPYMEVVDITSAEEMYQAVTSRSDQMDIIIKAAAVADYRPAQVSDQKVKKKDGDLSIPLERTRDILLYLGSHKRPGQFLCGFSMETEHMIENSQKKLVKKNLDMIAANNVKVAGAGFGVDTNLLTLITPERITELPLLSKDGAADALLDAILEAMQ
jgi:phosphopantothenoylcysteine decarboxylase/phosphopantothenate--cysteine ligase